MRPGAPPLERYFEIVGQRGLSPGNARYYLQWLFDGVQLAGSRMLDVGGGDGRFSFYAACAGATRVVALEPEAAGSAKRVTESFARTAAALGADGCHLIRQTLQEYEPGREAFDIVLLNASINHLDEDACIRLDRDLQAQNVYRELFGKLAAMTRPEGTLIAYDCSPRNLFARLGVRNPFLPTIEWYKHQPPERWIELLEASGFDRPAVRWSSFNRLRSPGRFVLGHRVPAYFLTSAFCLTMRRRH